MGYFDDIPEVKTKVGTGLFDDIPAAQPSVGTGLFDDIPAARPDFMRGALSGESLTPEPSDIGMPALAPVATLEPGYTDPLLAPELANTPAGIARRQQLAQRATEGAQQANAILSAPVTALGETAAGTGNRVAQAGQILANRGRIPQRGVIRFGPDGRRELVAESDLARPFEVGKPVLGEQPEGTAAERAGRIVGTLPISGESKARLQPIVQAVADAPQALVRGLTTPEMLATAGMAKVAPSAVAPLFVPQTVQGTAQGVAQAINPAAGPLERTQGGVDALLNALFTGWMVAHGTRSTLTPENIRAALTRADGRVFTANEVKAAMDRHVRGQELAPDEQQLVRNLNELARANGIRLQSASASQPGEPTTTGTRPALANGTPAAPDASAAVNREPNPVAPAPVPSKPLTTIGEVLAAKVEAQRKEVQALEDLHAQLLKQEQAGQQQSPEARAPLAAASAGDIPTAQPMPAGPAASQGAIAPQAVGDTLTKGGESNGQKEKGRQETLLNNPPPEQPAAVIGQNRPKTDKTPAPFNKLSAPELVPPGAITGTPPAGELPPAGNPPEVKSVKPGFVPPKFEIKKPIQGPTGAAIIGYEWRSKMGEKWSNREGGYVEGRVSDWDNSDTSKGTGRDIVHVFYVQHPDKSITIEGIRSAQNVLGIAESRLMTIAKKEQAAQAYREQQAKAEAEIWEKAAKPTAAEAARDYRQRNYSAMRSFEENNALFNESVLFEKGGKFVRRPAKAAEFMHGNGWKLVENDPAKPALTPPAKSATVPPAAGDTITVRTASPMGAGTDERTGSAMTVADSGSAGDHPAATPSSKSEQPLAEQIAQATDAWNKARVAYNRTKNPESKGRALEQVKSAKAALDKLIAQRQFEKRQARGITVERTQADRERAADIIDDIAEETGSFDYTKNQDEAPDWKPHGAARSLQRAGASSMDQVLRDLHGAGKHLGITSTDQLRAAISAAASVRKGARGRVAAENRKLDEMGRQVQNFERDNAAKLKRRQEHVVADTLNVGDEFTLNGNKFKVTDMQFDADGNVQTVTLSDGERYGTQTVDGETRLVVDKGSRKAESGKRKAGTQFAEGDALREEPGNPAVWNLTDEEVQGRIRDLRSRAGELTEAESRELNDLRAEWMERNRKLTPLKKGADLPREASPAKETSVVSDQTTKAPDAGRRQPRRETFQTEAPDLASALLERATYADKELARLDKFAKTAPEGEYDSQITLEYTQASAYHWAAERIQRGENPQTVLNDLQAEAREADDYARRTGIGKAIESQGPPGTPSHTRLMNQRRADGLAYAAETLKDLVGQFGAGTQQTLFAQSQRGGLTPSRRGQTISEAIYEKHQQASGGADPSGRDDVLHATRGGAQFARVGREAQAQGHARIWSGTRHAPEFYTTPAGRRLTRIATQRGYTPAFFNGPPEAPKAAFNGGTVLFKTSVPEAELAALIEHEIAHGEEKKGNPVLLRLRDLVDLKSPAAKAYEARRNAWLDHVQAPHITAADLASELVADAVAGRTWANLDPLDAFRNRQRAGELALEYHRGSTQFAEGDFRFDAPETVAEQKAREKAESGKRKAETAKADMLQRADARLTGQDIDTTREMFGAETKVDKAGQGSLFAEGDTPTPAKDWRELKAETDAALQGLRDVQKLHWLENRPKGMTRAEVMNQIALATAKYRTLKDELLVHPDYIAHLLTTLHEKSKIAGKDTAELEHIGAELSAANPKLIARVKADLQARGILPKKADPVYGRTLDQVTNWLRGHDSDSPKLTVPERLKLAARAATSLESVRHAMGAGWTKLAAGWQQFVAQYKRPPTDTEYRQIVKDWNFRDEWTGLEVRQFVEEMQRKIPSPTRRAAVSVWMDANGDLSLLKFQRDTVPDVYQPVWDAALKLTDTEKQIAMQLRQDFAQKLQDGLNLGLLDAGRADYGVPQVWKEPPKTGHKPFAEGDDNPLSAGNPMSTLDPRSPFFGLQRTVPDYFTGIMQGGKPHTLDVAKLAGYYDMAFHKALTSRDVINMFSSASAPDGSPVVKISGSAKPLHAGDATTYLVDSKTRGDAKTKDGRLYRVIDHWAMRGHKMAYTLKDGSKILVKGDMLVHPDFYAKLRNMLVQSDLRRTDSWGRITKPLLQANRFLKSSKLSMAVFHMTTEGLHAMFHLTNPFTNGFDINLRDPKQARLVRNGLELGMAQDQGYFMEGVGAHGGIWAHVPGIREVMGGFSEWLFKHYIPTLKMKAGLNMLDRNLKRYTGKLAEDQIYELTASQSNAAFGAQNYRLLARSPELRDILSLTTLAPDFLESRFKFVAQAFKPYNAEQRMALVFMAASVYVAARLLNALLDDDHDPHWAPKDAFAVYHGGRRYSLRTIVQDAFHLAFEPRSFWYNRMSAFTRTATEVATQRDWRGVKRTPIEQVEDMLSWLVPAGVEGMVPGTRKANEQSFVSAALGSAGIGSRKATAGQEIRELATSYVQEHGDAAAKRELEYQDKVSHPESAYRDLDNALDGGNVKEAKAEYDLLLTKGFTPKAVFEHYDVFSEKGTLKRPWTGRIATERAFFNSLTEPQRKAYLRAVEERKQRAAMLNRVRAAR